MTLIAQDYRWYLVLVLVGGVMACSGEPLSNPSTPNATQSVGRIEVRTEQALTGWPVDSMIIAGDPSLSQLFAGRLQDTSGLAALADEEPSSAVIQLSSTTASVTPLEVRASTQYIGTTASHGITAAITSSTPATTPPPWTFNTAGSGTSLGPEFTFLFTSIHPLTANVACDFTLSASTVHAAWYQIPDTPWPVVNAMTTGVWGRVTAGDGHSASGPSCVTFQQPGGGGGGDDTMLETDEQWYICTTFYVYIGGVLAQIIDGGCRPV